jgi:hypothetical protein
MSLVVAPITDGKLDAWKGFLEECKSGSKKEAFRDLNKRYQLSRHDVWHVETPGGPMAVVLHEGPGADEFMQAIGRSDHPFDVWMRENISEFHNIHFDQPPPGPPPEKLL